MLLGILRDIETPKKIVIYEKQNLHALVEMTSSGGARRVKEALDGKMWKSMFLIRVQYTSKKSLSVNPNSPMEYEAQEGDEPEEILNQEEDDERVQQAFDERQFWFSAPGFNGIIPPYGHPMYAQLPVSHAPPPVQHPPVYPPYQYQTYNVGPQRPYHAHPPSPVMKPQPSQTTHHPPSSPHQPPRTAGQTVGNQSPQLLPASKIPGQQRFPVQMQPLSRQEVDPKELYYYSGSHQYAPPQYPQLFNSPQIVPPYHQNPPVKFTHNQPDERYLLQYCSPMVRPQPLNRAPRPIQIYKIIKIEGLKENSPRAEPITNLCSLFGTVLGLKIVKKDKKSECFVQFMKHTEAQAAVDHLDGLHVMGLGLELTLTKYNNLQEIDIFEKGKTVSLSLCSHSSWTLAERLKDMASTVPDKAALDGSHLLQTQSKYSVLQLPTELS
jgi:hypothetical protein